MPEHPTRKPRRTGSKTPRPGQPDLVSATRVAEILGIPTTHVRRLYDAGRLPKPYVIDGGYDAWLRQEVEALADEMGRGERPARPRKKPSAKKKPKTAARRTRSKKTSST